MGWFSSKKSRERKEAQRMLDKQRKSAVAQSTVNPSTAITELQPWQVNAQEDAHKSLGQLQHKDVWGNEIREPDLSNPTRYRYERPLDTIRGFQESIDRGYRRNSLYQEGDAQSTVQGTTHGGY